MQTPATKFLDSKKISYKTYEYSCNGAKHDFGHIAATELNRDQNEVFKTLLIHHEKTYITAVIPVNCNLNLKNAAKVAGVKNAEMVKPEDAERYLEDAGYCGTVRAEVMEQDLPGLGYDYFNIGEARGEVSRRVGRRLREYADRELPSIADHIEILDVWMPWKRVFEVGLDVRWKD